MNQQEVSFRSDEQAQSQDRERLQSEIEKAFRRTEHMARCEFFRYYDSKEDKADFEADLRLLRWAAGVK
jgi:hypothetical protein